MSRVLVTGATRSQLERWFGSLSPDGAPRVDRLDEAERAVPAVELLGRRTFFTDANACVRRSAWREVPFRPIAHAEDQALALDMLRAGYAKVYLPGAAVHHSHDYTLLQTFRRAFDEWRGLLEVYGWREPASPARVAGQVRGELGARRRELTSVGLPAGQRSALLAGSAGRELARQAGALVGSRADRLPRFAARACSLEGR